VVREFQVIPVFIGSSERLKIYFLLLRSVLTLKDSIEKYSKPIIEYRSNEEIFTRKFITGKQATGKPDW